ncbi:hypothetical protein DKG79_26400 (plasmid) [Escherichia fergusonii]|nr:hypothetical protein DKG79_26400 [Escherichia fergusonii]
MPAAPCCPNCGGSLSYLGEDTAEQLELMRSASGYPDGTGKTCLYSVRCHRAGTCTFAAHRAGIAGPGCWPRADLEVCRAHPLYRQSEIYGRQGVELSRSLLSGWVDACCRCCLRWKRRFMAMS